MRFNPFKNSPLKGGVLGYVLPFHKCMNAISSTDQRLQVCIPRGTILIEGKSHGDFRVVEIEHNGTKRRLDKKI
jgi:hypothetical protein